MIVQVRVVFRKTVVGDWHFDYLSGSHLQSQVKKSMTRGIIKILSTDNDSSLDSEDEYHSISWNVSHQQKKTTLTQMIMLDKLHCRTWMKDSALLIPMFLFVILKVVEEIERGFRMPRPHNCPDVLHEIMLNCWKKEPSERPTFETLHWQLDEFFQTDLSQYKELEQ